jgi:hypothetical protein
MWISEITACRLLSIESDPPPMKPGKLPTAGENELPIEKRAKKLSCEEMFWSTRMSPWSALVERAGA